jgi:predicted nucleotidyltransferase
MERLLQYWNGEDAMWLADPLDEILSSRAKVRLLRVLASSRVPLNGREIARRAGVGAGTGSRLLRELAASGAVTELDQGSAHTYSLQLEVPFVATLRRLFEEEEARRRAVIRELAAEVPGLLAVLLFGSQARGEAQPGSDTDLLLVFRTAPPSEARLDEVCLGIATRHGLSLSWHVADLRTLEEWDRTGNDLWTSILREGVALLGRPPERLCELWRTGRAA